MKSLPPDAPFALFVETALAEIETEVSWAFADMARTIGSLVALVVVDGEPALVRRGRAGAVEVSAGTAEASVICVTTTRTILDLLHGRDQLLQALEHERVTMTGGVDAILSFSDVLEAFLHGAVRSRACESLQSCFEARGAIGREA